MAFVPVNSLEESLMKAASDPAGRPQFYRDFLVSTVYLVQHGVQPPSLHQTVVLEAQQTLKIQNTIHNGVPHVPIFSSLERLQAAITGEVAYIGINAHELLGIVNGSPVLLNPGSDFGKEFSVSEVASLVDGSIWKPTERYVVEKPTKVLLGQPKNYPTQLVQALSRHFATVPEIRKAWLAHYFNPTRDKMPHTLIGIEHSGKWDVIVSSAGMVANGTSIPDPPIDFMHVSESHADDEGVISYFRQSCRPFYAKKKLFGLFG